VVVQNAMKSTELQSLTHACQRECVATIGGQLLNKVWRLFEELE